VIADATFGKVLGVLSVLMLLVLAVTDTVLHMLLTDHYAQAAARYTRSNAALLRFGSTLGTTAAATGTAAAATAHAYVNYTRWREPMRHSLLRLRQKRPHLLGNRPVPLNEREVQRYSLCLVPVSLWFSLMRIQGLYKCWSSAAT
jgi:phage/plasmid-associated DNA primase